MVRIAMKKLHYMQRPSMRTKHVARLLIEAKAEKRQRIYATSHDVSLWTLCSSQALARGRSKPRQLHGYRRDAFNPLSQDGARSLDQAVQ